MKYNNDHAPDKEANSENDNKYEYLKKIDTGKLQTLLQQESFLSDDDNFDVELIRQIVVILNEREPAFENFDVAASLKAFKEEMIPELNKEKLKDGNIDTLYVRNVTHWRRSKRRVTTLLIAAVVTILLGSTLIASAMGYNFWEYVINWGKETFQIGTQVEVTNDPKTSETQQATVGEGSISMGSDSSYQSVEDAVKALNVSILIPNWIPDGYEFVQADISQTAQRKSMIASYQSEDKALMYNAVIYNSIDAAYSYEKDETSGETITANGVDYYFMTNLEQNRIVWIRNNVVYSINGYVTKDDLVKMLNSIYEGDNLK